MKRGRHELLAAFESDAELAAFIRDMDDDSLRDVLTVLLATPDRSALVELVRRLALAAVR